MGVVDVIAVVLLVVLVVVVPVRLPCHHTASVRLSRTTREAIGRRPPHKTILLLLVCLLVC
jgi:hypothetical protein